MSDKADTSSFSSDETEIRVFIDRTSTLKRDRHSSKQTEYNNIKYIYIYQLRLYHSICVGIRSKHNDIINT